MDQSEVIGGVLVGGFVLYLAMNNRLGTYWSILMGGGGTATPTSAAATDLGGAAAAGTGANMSATGTSGIASQLPGSIGTAGTPAVVGQPGSPAFVPSPNTIMNFLTGNWWQPAQTTSQGTQTPAGSSQAGGGIGMM